MNKRLLPDHPEVVQKLEIDGVTAFAVDSPIKKQGLGGYNGYVLFPEKPVKEPDYDGVLTYVPVHGGITYCEHGPEGSVYGFDTAHFDSEKLPRNDLAWIFSQCDILIRGIRLASTIEDAYLLAEGDNEKRAKLVQPICDLQASEHRNFGVTLNLLSGRL